MNDTHIPARWLTILRVLWLLLVLLLLGTFFYSISPYFNELRVACTGSDCLLLALSPLEAQTLRDLGLSMAFYAGYMVVLAIYPVLLVTPIAGLIFWRKSDTWLGYLLSLSLIFFMSASGASVPALTKLYPNLLWVFFFSDLLASALFVLLFYLFPDGRFVPPWTRVFIMLMIVGVLGDVLLLPIGGSVKPSYGAGANILWVVGLIVGAGSQIYRYRRVSTPVQRQQTKWVLFGLITFFTITVIWTLLFELFPLQSSSTRLILNMCFVGMATLLFTILPISVVFSILRYRLWDIDIIINRTLVYGLLTGVLALLYYGSVVLFQGLLRTLTGQGYQFVVVVSTLLIAVLFNPLRRRIQESIDRRFYRRKYDAEQVLAQFAATGRDEVDLDRLIEALLDVVEETIQPEHVSLWLVEPQRNATNRR